MGQIMGLYNSGLKSWEANFPVPATKMYNLILSENKVFQD